MIVIGVTGGVGTGKSTVARMFGPRGARVLDADRIAHELMEPGTPVYRRIRRLFGDEVIGPRGRMDRKKLGARVFHNPRQLRQLTGILHPAVRRKIREELHRLRQKEAPRGLPSVAAPGASAHRLRQKEAAPGASAHRLRRREPNSVVVLDIPLLVEAGSAYRTDALVVVSAPAAVAARRLRRRSGWSPEEIRRRGSFQLPLRQKEKQADFVVDNSRGLSSTRRQVLRIWEHIVKERKLDGGGKDG